MGDRILSAGERIVQAMAKLEVPKTGPPWQRSSNCASRTSTTGRMWQQVDDEIPRLHPRLFTMVRLSEVIMMMVMLQSFSCLVVVPVAAQPSTDPTEGNPPFVPLAPARCNLMIPSLHLPRSGGF